MRQFNQLLLLGPLMLLSSCVHVTTDPIEVKPITINVNLKVDQQLDQFFAFENSTEKAAATQAAATQASTTGADVH